MSKSKGNVLYADELVDFFGVDAVRYFVLHEMPFENDGVITWELMVERMNSDLANTLGNLVNRTVSMTNKYFGGTVTDKGVAEEVDADLKAVTESTPKAVEDKMEELRVADAMTEIFNLFKRCNKYIDETMPWVLAKDEAKKTSGNSSLEPHSEHFPRGRAFGILYAFYKQEDSGTAWKWSCNRKTGNPLRKTGSGRSSEKSRRAASTG